MPTGFPDMRGDCVAGREMAEWGFGGVEGGGEKKLRHTHYLSSLTIDGIPQDWERCKDRGMVEGESWWWWWWCRRG